MHGQGAINGAPAGCCRGRIYAALWDNVFRNLMRNKGVINGASAGCCRGRINAALEYRGLF